jgi:hypothetical protein
VKELKAAGVDEFSRSSRRGCHKQITCFEESIALRMINPLAILRSLQLHSRPGSALQVAVDMEEGATDAIELQLHSICCHFPRA